MSAASVVERIAADRGLTRVDQVASDVGMTVRGVQRLFAEHVGVGPKWVVRHHRLREAVAQLASGGSLNWSMVAADLGYADQAHFTRDFTAMLGEPPTRYALRYPPQA